MASDLLVAPVAAALRVAVSAALVALIAALVFVAHPRRWWTSRAFDVQGYLEDELSADVARDLRAVGAHARSKVVRRPAAVAEVSSDGAVSFTPGGKGRLEEAVSLRDFVLRTLPTAAKVLPDYELSPDDLGKRCVDMADASSLRNFNKGVPELEALADAWAMGGTPTAAAVLGGGMTPVAMSLDRPGLDALRAGLPNPELAAAVRAARDKRGPAAALLAACVSAGSDDEAWALLRADLDPVLECMAAIAQLRCACTFVFPQVRRMRMDRRSDMKMLEVFKLFNAPYYHEFLANCGAARKDFDATSEGLWRASEKWVEDLKRRTTNNLRRKNGKESFEQDIAPPFDDSEPDRGVYIDRETFFGVRVGPDGRQDVVEEFNPFSLLKNIVPVFKVLPAILKMLPALIKGLIDIVKALVAVLKLVSKDPLDFCVQLILLVVNAMILVFVIVWKPAITGAVWCLIALGPMILSFAFYAIFLVQASAMNLVMAFVDVASGGAVRHLALSEDHPESWWRTDGAHAGNRTSRMLGSMYPCASGYSPGAVPVYCSRVSRCVPLASPSAMLMRKLREGRLRPVASVGRAFAHPLIPDPSVACSRAAGVYAARSGARPTCNRFTMRADVHQELMVAACSGRARDASREDIVTVCRLCETAVSPAHRAQCTAAPIPWAAAPKAGRRARGLERVAGCLLVIVVCVAAVARSRVGTA